MLRPPVFEIPLRPRVASHRRLAPGRASVLCASLLAVSAVACPGAHAMQQNVARKQPAKHYYVRKAGSDTARGTKVRPFATISRAAAVARQGDVVVVGPGHYRETIGLRASGGVTFRGARHHKTVIDGEGTRDFGFVSNIEDLEGITIQGFQIAHQVRAGISMVGSGAVIRRNYVHDVGQAGTVLSAGIRVIDGVANRVERNVVSDIGPGGESMGVLLLSTRGSLVADNEIRLVRKEGIRDWRGLDNMIMDNSVSLAWTGIALNTSTGSAVLNNYLHDNVQGFNPKHVSSPPALTYWRLSQPHVSRFSHNTVYRSLSSSVALATNLPIADYIDVYNNVFSGAGDAFVADAPVARGQHVSLDGNFYSTNGGRPRWVYHAGYDYERDGYADLAGMRSALGWERTGRTDAPASVPIGAKSPQASVFSRLDGNLLEDGFGRQLGATDLPTESTAWIRYAMRPIRVTPKSSETLSDAATLVDGQHHTYWQTADSAPRSVTFDLGRARKITHIVLDVYTHFNQRAVRGYRFEVSKHGRAYWTVLAGENPDSEGSSFKYALRKPTRARYLRFRLLDTFCQNYAPRTQCGDQFIVSELAAGRLAHRRERRRR